MRKILNILVIMVMLMSMITGCNEEKSYNSDIFEKEFFENVVAISMSMRGKEITNKEDINKILDVLACVDNVKSDTALAGLDNVKQDMDIRDIYGAFGLEIHYEDGSIKTIGFTSGLICYNGITYVFNEEYCDAINNLFTD